MRGWLVQTPIPVLRELRSGTRWLAAATVILVAGLALSLAPRARAGGGGRLTGAEVRCVRAVLDGNFVARSLSGTASAATLSDLAVLRRKAASVDRFPRDISLAAAVGQAGGTSFDPTRVRYLSTIGGERVFLVAATVGSPRAAVRCARLRPPSGVSALLEQKAFVYGAGPGVCLLVTTDEGGPGFSSGECVSADRLMSYGAATFGIPDGEGHIVKVVPDGVVALQSTSPTGHTRSQPVRSNLIITGTAGAGLPLTHDGHARSLAAVMRELTAGAPVAVRYDTSARYPIAEFARPAGLLSVERAAISFELKLIRDPISG
jgi:hypothetical protein